MSTKITVDNIANNSVGITQLNVSDGSNGQFLTTDGAGNLSFSSLGTLTTLTVDNIGIDGSTISNSSGDITLDASGDIILDADGDDIKIAEGGTTVMEIKHESSGIDFLLNTTDEDYKFKGSDGGSTITALQLDMSEAGRAIFNAGANFGTTSSSTYAVQIQATTGGNALQLKGRNAAENAGWLAWTDYAGNVEAAMYATANNLIFANTTSYTERMRIDSSGNVGIGTSSPSRPLHIAKSSGTTILELQRTNTNTTGTTGAIQFNASDGHAIAAIAVVGDGDNEGGEITFRTTSAASENNYFNSTAERMRIDSSGNVGIGGTPTHQLHLISNIPTIKMTESDAGTDAFIQSSGGNLRFFADDGNAVSSTVMGFHLDGSERMRIDSSGNVGIACTDQSNLLTVDANSASTTTDSISVRNRGVTSANHTAGLRFQFNSAVPSAIRTLLTNTSSGAGTLSFFTSSDGSAGNLSERMRIDSSGSTQLKGYVGYGNYSATGSDTSQLIGVGARQRAMGGRGGQPNLLSWDTLDRSNSAYDDGSPINTFVSAYGVTFSPNGGSSTNTWILGEGPGGGIQWLWKGASTNPSNAGGQGGWDCSSFQIDTTYSYMLVNYVKRISSAATGTYYYGTQGVYDSGGGGLNNPYMTIRTTNQLPQGVWCCDVQFIVSHQYTGNVATQNTGLFRMDTGAPIQTWSGQFSGVNQYRSYPSSTNTHSIGFRTYLYYATANDGTTLHWAQPAVYKCDGTEPTLGELRGHRDARANNNV